MTRRETFRIVALGFGILTLALISAGSGFAAEKVLKIGQLGVMSGPAAAWGLNNKYSALATARMYNEKGGFDIEGEKYKIEIVSVDDKNDPKLAVTGAERLIHQEGVRYIIGPNVDAPTGSILPVVESGKAINIAYSFVKEFYCPPHRNTFLGMIANFQLAPIMIPYLYKERGVRSMSFLLMNMSSSFPYRDDCERIGKSLGMKIISRDITYELGTTDFFPQMSKIVRSNPDAIAIYTQPAETPLIVKAARELGYKGIMFCGNYQDAKVINEIAGQYANGLITPGGASTPEMRSKYMEDFIKVYSNIAGEWNDEASTKIYALEAILATLKIAGKKAINDVEVFMAAVPKFKIKNPFLKEDRVWKYVGMRDLRQLNQIGMPMVINEFRNGEFKPIYVSEIE